MINIVAIQCSKFRPEPYTEPYTSTPDNETWTTMENIDSTEPDTNTYSSSQSKQEKN